MSSLLSINSRIDRGWKNLTMVLQNGFSFKISTKIVLFSPDKFEKITTHTNFFEINFNFSLFSGPSFNLDLENHDPLYFGY